MSWKEDPEKPEVLGNHLLKDSETAHLIQPPPSHPNERPTPQQHHECSIIDSDLESRHRHTNTDSISEQHRKHPHGDSDLGQQHRHPNRDPNSQRHHRHPKTDCSSVQFYNRRPNGEPPVLRVQMVSETEPLLLPDGSEEPVMVPDDSEDFIQFVASECPSVVPASSHGDRYDIRGLQNDASSDVTVSRQERSSQKPGALVYNNDAKSSRQRGAELSNHVRNRFVADDSIDDSRREGLFVDVTIPPDDANKEGGDVTGTPHVRGPSSPAGGSVARSFTSDCICTLGEERGREEEEEGGGGKSDHLLHPDSHHVRRLSSGDKPRWLLTAQDGSSDVHNMTLVVPGPPRANESYLLGRANPRGDVALVRMTRMTEVAPTNSSLVNDEDQWRMPLQLFTSKKQGSGIGQYKSKRIRSYYKAQDVLITAYEDISLRVNDDLLDTDIIKRQRKLATFFSKLTLAINLVLLIGKLVASVLSGSISIISSMVDSVVDLLSGVIMWWATRAVKTRDPYTYPQGRTKLEPVAIIILSVVMALASLQLVRESVEKVVSLASDPTDLPRMEIPTFVIAGSTVVVKLVLWLMCRRVRSSIVQALAMDHRNDVLSNSMAIVCGYLGSREFQKESGLQGFIYVDPAGAIVISLYIVINWWHTGSEQIKMLTGHTARPDFLSKLTWTAMNHDRNIRHIDTVRAFHFGNNFLVEMDIVLPEDMSLRVAHDIGESLQQKLENIPEVERAFVHLDYEFSHNPNTEHKVV